MDESKAGSSPYGIFIYLELRKDSRVDFPFPLSSILDLLMNCFDPILVSSETFCEVKIPEECTPTRSDSDVKIFYLP